MKIADLELGITEKVNKERSMSTDIENKFEEEARRKQSVDVTCMLGNWLAPEVLTNGRFMQASDVYALGTCTTVLVC